MMINMLKGLVTQWLEYTPDKRGVSSSNLLEPINTNRSFFIAIVIIFTILIMYI